MTISDEDKIRQLDKEWGEAADSHDVEAVLKFYSPNATLVWPEQPAIHGAAAIRDAWTGFFKDPNYENLSLGFTPKEIRVSGSRDLAIDFGVVAIKFGPAKNQQTVIAKYLVVWTAESGDWKVLYDSWNSNEPAGKAPA